MDQRDNLPSDLQDLSDRLASVREQKRPEPRRNASASMITLAYRLTIEIIAAIGVTGFIGWWIDKVLGTKPSFLLIMLFLGVVAGLVNSVRTVNTLKQRVDDAEKMRRPEGQEKDEEKVS